MSQMIRYAMIAGVWVVGLAWTPESIWGQSLRGQEVLEAVAVESDPPQVKRGQAFVLNVDVTIAPGLHLQAHKPLQDYLIGTELTVPEVDGVVWGAARYPAGKERKDPYLGALLEYQGKVRIQQPGRVSVETEPGERTLELSLGYQACDDKGSCFPPQTVPIRARLHVLPEQVAAGEGAADEPVSGAAGRADSAGVGGVSTPAGSPGGVSGGQQGTALPWQPFSSKRLTELTAGGKTVLIDFTADWCPNCKLNEFLALNTRAAADVVSRNGVVPLLADFTREDPEIRAWLAKFESISVPLTVIVPGKDPARPIILRDTYRQGTLLAALKQAGPSVAGGDREGLTLDTPIVLSESGGSVWWYLLGGLLGGFILNFMPCVLPVISIKVLSLVGQAGKAPRRVLGLGLAFAAGMVALFVGLGLLVTVVGQTWGALFQSTTFLLVMLGILVAMAASLFGAFTLAVPGAVGDADAAIEGEGYVGSFGKGVLAVLLGTPCSGPFLGSALAWSAGRSAAGQAYLGMLVFVSMGVGMALPFVVLAIRPGWMRFIPRPGAWMETFKQFMGFLLLLTAVYVVSILEAGVVKWAVLFAFGVGLASWLYGRLVRPGRSAGANWVGRVVAAAVVVAFAWVSFAGLQGIQRASSNLAVGQTGVVEWPGK